MPHRHSRLGADSSREARLGVPFPPNQTEQPALGILLAPKRPFLSRLASHCGGAAGLAAPRDCTLEVRGWWLPSPPRSSPAWSTPALALPSVCGDWRGRVGVPGSFPGLCDVPAPLPNRSQMSPRRLLLALLGSQTPSSVGSGQPAGLCCLQHSTGELWCHSKEGPAPHLHPLGLE